jgi:hypothetical protein
LSSVFAYSNIAFCCAAFSTLGITILKVT